MATAGSAPSISPKVRVSPPDVTSQWEPLMPNPIIDCDVVIQAGHENTPDDKTGGEGPLGKEIEWTPIVANTAVAALRAAGVNAIKETAHIKVTHQKYRSILALFVNFDDPDHGEAGPSLRHSPSHDAGAPPPVERASREVFPA